MEPAVAAAARLHASSGLTSLCHRLAKQLTAEHDAGAGAARNLVFSPLSIYSALSLVAAGAQGKTLRELLHLLGAAGSRDGGLHADVVRAMVEQAIPQPDHGGGGPRVSYASALWHDSTRTPKPAYLDVAAASFRSAVRAADFLTKPGEAVTQINSWVAESTNNLIDSIVDRSSVNSITSLVVANAIYFKGGWKSPFYEERTEEDKFHRLDGSAVDAQFMRSFGSQFIGVHDGFKLLRMPYMAAVPAGLPRTVPPQYSMCVLLPDTRDGLEDLVDAVASSSSPSFLQDNLPLEKAMVGKFMVPRFKVSFSTGMRDVLRGLGVQAVFSEAAELPDLLLEEEDDGGSHEPLFLGDVLHKAVIEVNEEGTEAAAVTAATFRAKCARTQHRPPRVDFVADHPFAFFVVEEESGAILFAGHVLDPTQPA